MYVYIYIYIYIYRFNNQNHEGGHFQYRQIDTVVQRFIAEGRRVLLVLHPKWLKEDADLSVVRRKRKKLDPISTSEAPPAVDDDDEDADEQALVYPHDVVTEAERTAEPGTPLGTIRSWKEAGVLLRVPTYDCDDWYWLYAALDSLQRGVKHVQVAGALASGKKGRGSSRPDLANKLTTAHRLRGEKDSLRGSSVKVGNDTEKISMAAAQG